jgi:hypothetical protein
MAEADTTIYCEACGLPHRRGAVQCDRCEHALGTEPNWEALRAELPQLKGKIVLGFVSLVAIIALNILVFGGAGYIVLLAPIGWIIFSAYRHVVLSAQLRGAEPRAPHP